jgi:hypothetical protein
MPVLLVPIHESNDCHNPAGSPVGGQFCSTEGGGGGGGVPAPPKLSGWGTPVEKVQGDRMADLRPQVKKGDLVIGQRFEEREGSSYGGVMVVEFGKVTRVYKEQLDVLRPDGTKTRIDAKIAVFRRPDETASAEAVWQHYEKYGFPGHPKP